MFDKFEQERDSFYKISIEYWNDCFSCLSLILYSDLTRYGVSIFFAAAIITISIVSYTAKDVALTSLIINTVLFLICVIFYAYHRRACGYMLIGIPLMLSFFVAIIYYANWETISGPVCLVNTLFLVIAFLLQVLYYPILIPEENKEEQKSLISESNNDQTTLDQTTLFNVESV
jgi:hypothetical protein